MAVLFVFLSESAPLAYKFFEPSTLVVNTRPSFSESNKLVDWMIE